MSTSATPRLLLLTGAIGSTRSVLARTRMERQSVWSGDGTRVVWHTEGGKGTPSQIVHFQVRPDPLAK